VFVAAGPNHHQRIMMRLESGGSAKLRCKSEVDCAVWAHEHFDVSKPEIPRNTDKKSLRVGEGKMTRCNLKTRPMRLPL